MGRLRCLLSRKPAHMRSSNPDPMGPGFEWRLKAALDRVTPPFPTPRYLSVGAGRRTLRLAPFALAAAATALLALSATAATGSPNPVVWTERATTTIESVGQPPPTMRSTEPSPNQPTNGQREAPAAPTTHEPEHRASPKPEPSESPQPSESPEPPESPSEDHSESSSGSGPTRPSPTESPRPTPTPDEH